MRPQRYHLGRVVVWVVRRLVSLLIKLEVRGVERLPRTGAVLIIGNHVNFVDPVLAYTVQRRYVKGLTAAETFRNPLYRFFAWAVDAIPVERGTPDLGAIRACIESLKAGQALYIAPEGTRSGDGQLQKGRAGVVLVLLQAGTHIPIYPIAFIGLEHFWPTLKRLRRTPVRIVVGEPFTLCPPPGRVRQAEREEIVREMMGQIAALLPPQNRGVYADQLGREPRRLCSAAQVSE